ncbi:site-2 protease family protein, partial [Streptococcus pyogenes]
IVAKKNGVVVNEFSVGMGPRIISHVAKSGTRYSVKILPFGGSCAMLGEDEDNEEEGSFNSKSIWARMAIIFAGPLFNFILAFILS